MGAESPAIIGSILSIIVIVALWKTDCIQRRESTEKPSENERYTECMEHLSTDSVSDHPDQSALPGIASYIRE